ncbi:MULTISPECIES: VOC family protein [Streptomyces]|uniref:VOC family protein n=1 Tax=Streptomyces morookaense TaxID=1970 RepID=A0A7Y7E8F0_STRMO|nr:MULTISPECIES: VOC family protein [Streptomyces]MCC2275305.1 VOC family protein [Streptomyces sp. ET3-23]NVK79364.1 VOC family protein [Streptomyces morookaense]
MPTSAGSAPGSPNWIALSTPDPAASAAFYGALLAWELTPGGHFRLAGRTVAGALADSRTGRGTWTVSFRTADAAATAAAVERAGGYAGPGGLADPAGARFAVREPGEGPGLETVDAPGSLWWTQLYTPDVQAAKDFYRAVFAWDTHDLVLERGAVYTVVTPQGGGMENAHGGIMRPLDATPVGWLPYFAVANCDAAVTAAIENGGHVVHPPESQRGIGRQATLRDPFGAWFAVNARADA